VPHAVLSWSGGKDCSLALHALRHGDPAGEDGSLTSGDTDGLAVEALLTTVTADHDRVSMRGVCRDLVERQAAALDLPLRPVTIPEDPSMDRYRDLLSGELADCHAAGLEAVVYGDLHLSDVRAAREDLLGTVDLTGRWPLWGTDTDRLAARFVDLGFEARVVCVDASALDRSFVGRRFDRSFLDDLPPSVDPCGEDGEFHTFVCDGPPFAEPVSVRVGDTVERELSEGRFYHADLVLDERSSGRDGSRSGES